MRKVIIGVHPRRFSRFEKGAKKKSIDAESEKYAPSERRGIAHAKEKKSHRPGPVCAPSKKLSGCFDRNNIQAGRYRAPLQRGRKFFRPK